MLPFFSGLPIVLGIKSQFLTLRARQPLALSLWWLPPLPGRSPLMRRGRDCIYTQSIFPEPLPPPTSLSATIPFVELFSFTATFDMPGTLMGHPFPVPLPRSGTNLSKVFVTRTQTAAHRVHCYGHALPHRGARPPRRLLLCFSLPSSSPDAELSPPVAPRGFMKDLGARVVCPP